MAQNDYFVIVYQVLKYLYECLKKGEKPEACYLTASAYNIPENYWQYIILSLITEEYVKGIITPKGISYLFENSLIEKAKRTLKDVKEMVPFV